MDPNNQNSTLSNAQAPIAPEQSVSASLPSQPTSVPNSQPDVITDDVRPVKKNKLLKWILICIGVFVTFIVFTFIIAITATEGPRKVTQQQFSDIVQGNVQGGYDLFSTDAKQITSMKQFQQIVDGSHLVGSNATLQIISTNINNNKANISATIISDKLSGSISYILINENGTWKIEGFQMGPK